MNPLFLLIFCFFTSLRASDNFSTPFPCQTPSAWAVDTVPLLSDTDLTVCLNTLYLLYANNIIQHKIYRLKSAILQMGQHVRDQADDTSIDNDMSSIEELKKALTKLSILVGARKIYARMLQSCMESFNNKSANDVLSAQLFKVKDNGNVLLNHLLDVSIDQLAERHTLSVEKLMDHCSALQEITKLHLQVSNKSVLEKIALDNTDFGYPSIILLEELARNNAIALHNTESLLNELNSSNDFVINLLGTTQRIYYAYYKALYEQIALTDELSKHAVALFGLCGMLPEECTISLPHPDKVFEHALQTVKLYTQVEVTQ